MKRDRKDAQPPRFAAFMMQGLVICGESWYKMCKHKMSNYKTSKSRKVQMRKYPTDTPVTGKVNRAGQLTFIGTA